MSSSEGNILPTFFLEENSSNTNFSVTLNNSSMRLGGKVLALFFAVLLQIGAQKCLKSSKQTNYAQFKGVWWGLVAFICFPACRSSFGYYKTASSSAFRIAWSCKGDLSLGTCNNLMFKQVGWACKRTMIHGLLPLISPMPLLNHVISNQNQAYTYT